MCPRQLLSVGSVWPDGDVTARQLSAQVDACVSAGHGDERALPKCPRLPPPSPGRCCMCPGEDEALGLPRILG